MIPIGKILLIKILDTFTNKFAALNLAFPSILKQAERKKLGDDTAAAADDDFDFEKAKSIHTASSSTDIQVDPAKGRALSVARELVKRSIRKSVDVNILVVFL